MLRTIKKFFYPLKNLKKIRQVFFYGAYEFEPYTLDRLEILFQNIRNSKRLKIKKNFFERNSLKQAANIFIRIDVDLPECVNNVKNLIDYLETLSIYPAVFVRVDGRDYDPSTMVDHVEYIRKKNLECGLHTSCYIEADPAKAFRSEIDQFNELFGFHPQSVTFHGYGKEKVQERISFSTDLANNIEDYGIKFCDTLMGKNQYRYVIQDCHFNSKTKSRYLKKDFYSPQAFIPKTGDILILLHPCYWEKGSAC